MLGISKDAVTKKVTLTFSVRVLAIALVIFALFTSFAIWGGYQGIAANHKTTQQLKQSTDQLKQTQTTGHAQRLQEEADAKAINDASFCDVVYFFDSEGVKNAAFLEHLRVLHHCLPASAHPAIKGSPKITITPGTLAPTTPGTGSSSSPKAGSGGQSHSGGHPTPSPTPRPTPTPKPIVTVPSILAPVCIVLAMLLGTCIVK